MSDRLDASGSTLEEAYEAWASKFEINLGSIKMRLAEPQTRQNQKFSYAVMVECMEEMRNLKNAKTAGINLFVYLRDHPHVAYTIDSDGLPQIINDDDRAHYTLLMTGAGR